MAHTHYVPNRRDVIWLDSKPTKGRETGKYRPALVLSSRDYNRRTGLLICCPISTSIRGGPTEVRIDKLDQPVAGRRTQKLTHVATLTRDQGN